MTLPESKSSDRPHGPVMAPLIDVVFLLLIFFMLTLRIVAPESAVDVRMPAARAVEDDEPFIPSSMTVRLVADGRGDLADLRYGGRSLDVGDGAFDRLNREIALVVASSDASVVDELEVELDADPGLKWDQPMRAITAVRGRLDDSESPPRVDPLIERIRFAVPRAG